MRWKIIVTLAIVVTISSFLFLFTYHQTEPTFLSMPYILWVSIAATIVMVVLTFLGSKYFPFKEK
jgi:hypothetical protein